MAADDVVVGLVLRRHGDDDHDDEVGLFVYATRTRCSTPGAARTRLLRCRRHTRRSLQAPLHASDNQRTIEPLKSVYFLRDDVICLYRKFNEWPTFYQSIFYVQ